MSAAARPYWRDPDRPAVAAYAERIERKEGALDRFLVELWGGAKARFTPRRNASGLLVETVLRAADGLPRVADREIHARARAIRGSLARHGFTPSLTAASFALVREATRRTLGIEHRPVQIHGAAMLLQGSLLEMATGEGKTVTATLAAATAALAGRAVHVVTVNDYLAERDQGELGPIYFLLGLTTGLVVNGVEPAARRVAYGADVVYVDNKQIAFDYLRDRMALGQRRSRARAKLVAAFADPERASATPELILRGLDFAIVDEADSVLIDEARTPLVISSEGGRPDDAADYREALRIGELLSRGPDFAFDAAERSPRLTNAGRARAAAETASRDGLWAVRRAREERVTQALSALHVYRRDEHYILADGKVQIVDEFTGRVMPDRSWEAGLHQMIEAKEDVALTGRRTTISRITYQRFFRRYRHLCGMTGTGLEVAGELQAGYDLRTRPVPTHRPVQRRHLGSTLHPDAAAKRDAVVARVAAARARGQPVLIGVRSVAASDALSEALSAAAIAHVVLNARQDAIEAEIVARAGEPGAVTVATNMAGRGTDIRLGGGVADRGGLHVILTEFHESGRIDRQLYGRAARQGDPGSCEAIVALDDELFAQQLPAVVRVLSPVTRAGPWRGPLPALLRVWAQARAGRNALAIRRLTEKRDKDVERQLAFAGRAE